MPTPHIVTEADRKMAEHIFQSQAPGPEIKWGHCPACDATLSRVSELIAAYRQQIVRETREKCAKVCEGDTFDSCPDTWSWHQKDYARAIRALGDGE